MKFILLIILKNKQLKFLNVVWQIMTLTIY